MPAGRWRILEIFGTDLLDCMAPLTGPDVATY